MYTFRYYYSFITLTLEYWYDDEDEEEEILATLHRLDNREHTRLTVT